MKWITPTTPWQHPKTRHTDLVYEPDIEKHAFLALPNSLGTQFSYTYIFRPIKWITLISPLKHPIRKRDFPGGNNADIKPNDFSAPPHSLGTKSSHSRGRGNCTPRVASGTRQAWTYRSCDRPPHKPRQRAISTQTPKRSHSVDSLDSRVNSFAINRNFRARRIYGSWIIWTPVWYANRIMRKYARWK